MPCFSHPSPATLAPEHPRPSPPGAPRATGLGHCPHPPRHTVLPPTQCPPGDLQSPAVLTPLLLLCPAKPHQARHSQEATQEIGPGPWGLGSSTQAFPRQGQEQVLGTVTKGPWKSRRAGEAHGRGCWGWPQYPTSDTTIPGWAEGSWRTI